MRDAVRARGPVALLLGAIAVAVISLSPAPAARAQSMSESCGKTLTEQFGVTELSDVNSRKRSGHSTVYADATLKSGEKIRVRCLFREGGVSEVQVFEKPGMGASRDWPTWGPADAYRVEPEGTATETAAGGGDTEQAAAPAEPEQVAPEQVAPGEGTPPGQPAEQPADQAPGESAGQQAEQPAEQPSEQASGEESAKQAAEPPAPQYGVRKKAPTN